MITHGQELSNEFLDDMWTAILMRIPNNKWVEITKNYDKAIAAIKHFIDMASYGEDFCLTFSNDFKYFKKVVWDKPAPRYARFNNNTKNCLTHD